MARKTFLLQGLTVYTHLESLKRLLALADLERVLLSVAFVTKGGVDLIASELATAGNRVDAFVGIRNEVTTREGLVALMDTGANVHLVDTGARNLLFHPKIYICRCETRASAIIGSANLTVGGLNNNIESSVIFELDLMKDDDLSFVESIFAGFDGLVLDYPLHVARVEREADLEVLHSQGRLVDEASSLPPRGVSGGAKDADDLPRIGLKVVPLRSLVNRPPTGQRQSSSGIASTVSSADSSSAPLLELLWQSKALTERDLGIPSGRNTHAAGSINLDKGLLEKGIDHRHYFREEVFATLSWKLSSRPTVEEAQAKFRLIVKGVDRGEFSLRIGHTTNRTSRSYLQRNAMTRLSWGPMREFVARRDLIGRTMALYRDKTDLARFVVEID